LSRLTADPLSGVAATVRRVSVLATTAEVVWRVVLQPFAPYLFGLVALMCLACAAFGTALNRAAFERG
jgi:hypothetical protein